MENEIEKVEQGIMSNDDIIEKVGKETNLDEIKNLTKLFNINLVKKNMIRVSKESELLDLIIEQASSRFKKRPDEISNKDLLDYLNAIQTSVEKSNKVINSIDETPMIQITQNTNKVDINMNSPELDRESREKVLNVVKYILNQSENSIEDKNKDIKTIDIDEEIEKEQI